MRAIATAFVITLLVVSLPQAHAEAPSPATLPASGADDALYWDPDGQSSATVTQVLPNSSTSQMILTNVTAIHVRQGILIINWGGTATTLLPNQFVSGLTVNKRASATTRP